MDIWALSMLTRTRYSVLGRSSHYSILKGQPLFGIDKHLF